MVTVVVGHLWEDEVAAVDWQPIELGCLAGGFSEVASVDLIQLEHPTDVTSACFLVTL